MDPEPSSSRLESRVASQADTRSETWSAASSTIVDTRSEPPRCYGKDADKIMRRATGKGSATTSGSKEPMATPPVTLTAKIANKNTNNNNSSGSKAGSKSSKASAAASVASSAISGLTKQSTVNNNTKKSSSSSKSVNRGSSSASAARSVDSSKKSTRSKKSSSSKAAAASATSKHGRTTSPSFSAASTSSSIRSSNKTSSSNNRHGDAETTTNSSHHSHHSGSHISGSLSASAAPSAELSNLALVPMTATSAAAGGAMDPPSGASTSGSSSSTECTGPTLYDPPTTDGNSTYASQSQMSGGLSERSVSPNNEQLAVWSEGNTNDEDTTLRSDERGSDVISGASSESSYYSSDDDEESEGEGGERALVPIAEDRSTSSEEEGSNAHSGTEDSKNARALVQSDYHGGVNSYVEHGGAIVPTDPNTTNANRFLATAVDNHHAIVPIDSTIYEAYDHTFVTCPENLRFRFLYTFLKKNLDKKVMIFFSTTNSAKFHARLLSRFNIPVLTMHGNQRREKFIGRFFKFSDLEEGILCATDGAGRDLDIPPSVDWVIQFEPPDDPSEYILRVARISCDSDRVGRSLLFLNPGEQGFLKYYHSASIPVSEFEIPRQLADVQGAIERHVNESERLLRCARDAYGSYLLAYASHGFRDVYNVHDLNKGNVALGFGLVGTLPGTADDMTTETDTLVSSYVNGIGGGELGGDAAKRKSSGSSSSGGGGGGSKKSWEKKDKPKSKSWMRGEKSWPHSQIKLHPKFKGSDVEY